MSDDPTEDPVDLPPPKIESEEEVGKEEENYDFPPEDDNISIPDLILEASPDLGDSQSLGDNVVDLSPDEEEEIPLRLNVMEERTIHGTTIVEGEVIEKYRKFLLKYEINRRTNKSKYYMKFMRMKLKGRRTLDIDMRDLFMFDEELYRDLVSYPQEMIGIMDIVSTSVYDELFSDDNELEDEDDEDDETDPGLLMKVMVRPFNLPQTKRIRTLETNDIDRLICIRGMVTRVCDVVPDLSSACFLCSHCGSEVKVNVVGGHIREPKQCSECNSNEIELVHNQCTFDDKQHIKLQETPESIPEGETPRAITVIAHDLNVDSLKPGDRVDVTGIYRAVERRKTFGKRTVDSIVVNFVDVVHFSLAGGERLEDRQERLMNKVPLEDQQNIENGVLVTESETNEQSEANWDEEHNKEFNEELHISSNEEKRFRELSQRKDIYQILTRSLSPSIYGMTSIKQGILSQLFGGTNKNLPHMRIRGDLHILLMGDPGTSKSQLLLQAIKIAPRGIYTSGKGSSSVGLTAYVQRDATTGELVLESGALVLSDQGICCIDEFDKMSEFTRSMLHEVMEQQTVSIAKAGIVCSLNARTSILASANPLDSKYNDKKSFIENIDLPPPLLSRFDMIFLVRDNTENDELLANHIVSLFEEEEEDEGEDDDIITLDQKELRKFVFFARKTFNPILSEEIEEMLVKIYLKMRKRASGKRELNATPRQLESIVRMCESIAKMHFRNEVTLEDVKLAFEIMKETVYFQTAGKKFKKKKQTNAKMVDE